MAEKTTKEATPTEAKKKSKKPILPVIFIVVLLILNGFLLFYNWQANESNEKLTIQRDSIETLKIKLEQDYNQAKADLEAQLGKNAELDSVIQMQLEELASQKEEIKKLIYFKGQYYKKKALVDGLNRSIDNYIARIDSMKKAFAITVDTLNQKIAAGLEENEKLMQTNDELSAKVAVGSILKAVEINASGIQVKGSGKEKETTKAKKTNKIDVNFVVAENKVAEPGEKELLLRIVAPDGTTLSVDSKGSGMFTPEGMNSQIKYSLRKTINFNNESKAMSMSWSQETEFIAGTYKIEVYNDNYLSGKSTLVLD